MEELVCISFIYIYIYIYPPPPPSCYGFMSSFESNLFLIFYGSIKHSSCFPGFPLLPVYLQISRQGRTVPAVGWEGRASPVSCDGRSSLLSTSCGGNCSPGGKPEIDTALDWSSLQMLPWMYHEWCAVGLYLLSSWLYEQGSSEVSPPLLTSGPCSLWYLEQQALRSLWKLPQLKKGCFFNCSFGWFTLFVALFWVILYHSCPLVMPSLPGFNLVTPNL